MLSIKLFRHFFAVKIKYPKNQNTFAHPRHCLLNVQPNLKKTTKYYTYLMLIHQITWKITIKK